MRLLLTVLSFATLLGLLPVVANAADAKSPLAYQVQTIDGKTVDL
jgi:hypothetical protein